MSFDRDDKVDIIDLLINLLRDHEKKLDEISYRLEKLAEGGQPLIYPEEPDVTPRISYTCVTAIVSKWSDFRERCQGSELIAFKISESLIHVTSLNGSILYVFEEQIPSIMLKRKEDGSTQVNILDLANTQTALSGKLECGLELETTSFESKVDGEKVSIIKYVVSHETAKNWLTSQLGVDSSQIIEGELSQND